MPLFDDFGRQRMTAADPATASAWDKAIKDFFAFRGDPVTDCLTASAGDAEVVMTDVFAATMFLLDGERPEGAALSPVLARLMQRQPYVTPREQGHITAVMACAEGEFSAGARAWDLVLDEHPLDVVAMKLAHECYFLVGDAAGMLRSVSAARPAWTPDTPGFGFMLSMLAFSQEENGIYDRAEGASRLALELDPDDCWALHALVHTYEMQDRHFDCIELLEATCARWSNQPLFLAHIWWHLCLRLVAGGRLDEALDILDRHLVTVSPSSGFRLTDATSLMWRLELDGHDLSARWPQMRAKWDGHLDRHCNGFLDLHMAMTLAATGTEAEIDHFLQGCDAPGDSELAEIRREVTGPACAGIIASRKGDAQQAIDLLEEVLPRLHRIGGSNAQRDIVNRTLTHLLIDTGQLEKADTMLRAQLEVTPNNAWVLRQLALVEKGRGKDAHARIHDLRAALVICPVGQTVARSAA